MGFDYFICFRIIYLFKYKYINKRICAGIGIVYYSVVDIVKVFESVLCKKSGSCLIKRFIF